MLPGVINAHVHLAFHGGPDTVATLRATEDAALAAAMAQRAQQMLACGVTTVRDLGDRGGLAARLRDRIAAGELPGPRILTSGAPLTIKQGHCWFLGGEVAGPGELRPRVRALASAGVDLIKVMASGGQLTPNSPPMWATLSGTTWPSGQSLPASHFPLPGANSSTASDQTVPTASRDACAGCRTWA